MAGLGPLLEDSRPLVLVGHLRAAAARDHPHRFHHEARPSLRCIPMTATLRRVGVDRLHLIESCPDWPGDDDLGNGPWPYILRQRLRNETDSSSLAGV